MLRILIFLCLSIVSLLGQKDTLVIAVENEISRINPAFSEDHDVAVELVFSGLTRFDENLTLRGDLAKSWKIDQNGLVYEFELRNDVFWHDGVKFDARDVKFSLEAFKDPKNNSNLGIRFEELEKVEILNPYKVKVILKNPYPALLDALSVGIIPVHLLEGKDLNTDGFNQNPIGTGPFKFVQWKKGEYMEFKANENYHLGKVQTQRLFLKRILDSNVAALALKNSQIDAALIESSLLKAFDEDPRFNILRERSADYRALMFNFENEFLRDKRVRLALNYAVDRRAIVENILHGYGFEASHPLELSWASPANFKRFDYDLKKAQILLEEAGFRKNKEGFYEKDSKTLEFDIYAMSNDPLRVVLAGVLQNEFRKLGVKTNVITKLAGSFDYSKVDSFLIGWGNPYDPDFHTFEVFTSFNDTNLNSKGWNFGHYHNARVDESLFKARISFNEEERKRYYKEFINALNEDPPFIFLVYLDFALVYDKNIKGIKPRTLGHHGVGFSWNAYEWSKN